MRIQSIIAALALWVGLATAHAQGTAFTYQGRLRDQAGPVSGTYDFQLTVYDAASGGQGLGVFPLTATAVVSNGFFALTVDPGPGVFTGEARWLELGVRTNGPGEFTNPAQRQPFTATPYAIAARQLTGPVAPENIAAGTITSTMLATGSVASDQLADGAVSQAKLDPALAESLSTSPWARANVLSATNTLDFQSRTGSPTADQVAALIAATNANDLCFGSDLTATNGTTRLHTLYFDGTYSAFSGNVFNFSRTNVTQPSDLRWYTVGDETNYFAMGPDFGTSHDFFALAFAGNLQLDTLRMGTSPTNAGRFAMGTAGVLPGTQFAIEDVSNSVSNTLVLSSAQTGIRLYRGAAYSDALLINKSPHNHAVWLCWHQEDETADWRMGMGVSAKSWINGDLTPFDFLICQARGDNADPASPGTEYLRIEQATGAIHVPQDTLYAKAIEATNASLFRSTLTAAAFVGNGASLTNLNAGALASGTLPDERLSPNVALRTNLTGLVTSDQVGAQISGSNYVTGPTLAETNAALAATLATKVTTNAALDRLSMNDGSGLTNLHADALTGNLVLDGDLTATNGVTTLHGLFFDGDYSTFSGRVFNYSRPTTNVPSDVRWYTVGNETNYFAMGPDFGGGDFFALAFLGSLQQDLLRVGTEGAVRGKFAIGVDGLNPTAQLSIHDLNDSISNTVEILSERNGIVLNSRSRHADGLTLQRDDDIKANWVRWFQGNGQADWRLGMKPGSYDWSIYQVNGGASDPSTPGEEYVRIDRATGNFNVPLGSVISAGVITTNATVIGELTINGATLTASSNRITSSVALSAPAIATPGVVNAANGFAVGGVVGISSTQVVMTSFTTFATNIFINGILVSTTYKKP